MADKRYCYISGNESLSMRSLLVLGALLVSASPVLADDFVYLRCETMQNLTYSNSKTSKILDNRRMSAVNILQVDLKKKTLFDTRSTRPIDVTIQGTNLSWRNAFNTIKSGQDVSGKINLVPPYQFSSGGVVTDKTNNINLTFSEEGSCAEIDASEFQEALNQ